MHDGGGRSRRSCELTAHDTRRSDEMTHPSTEMTRQPDEMTCVFDELTSSHDTMTALPAHSTWNVARRDSHPDETTYSADELTCISASTDLYHGRDHHDHADTEQTHR